MPFFISFASVPTRDHVVNTSESTIADKPREPHVQQRSPSGEPLSIDRILETGTTVVAFLIPIKLSFTYIALFPLILLWLFKVGVEKIRLKVSDPAVATTRRALLVPLSFFLIAVGLHSLVGVDPVHSIRPFLSLVFFSLTLLFFLTCSDGERSLRALVWGQTLAAFHSCLDAAYPIFFESIRAKNLFIGKVTESGQLSLVTIVALSLAWTAYQKAVAAPSANGDRVPYKRFISLFAVTTLIWILLAFRNDLQLSFLTSICMVALAVVISLGSISLIQKKAPADKNNDYAVQAVTSLCLQLPLLCAALLANLKRGPLLGVFVGGTIFLLFVSRRIARIFVGVAALIALTIEPIRERIAASIDHFFISGGRSTIWRIGGELATKLPTGLGFHNSFMLREYAPEIPPELKHFHNNVLNILAENGWLSLGIFLWLIGATLTMCFKDRANTLRIGIGCALISWQIAGLVEYNFGDSEVLLAVWTILGTSFAVAALKREHSPSLP